MATAVTPPDMRDYDAACASFSWDEAYGLVDGLPGGRGLNIAYEAVDRHVAAGRGGRPAVRFLGRTGDVRDVSFTALQAHTNRFANVLASLGVRRGEAIAVLTGRGPAFHTAVLGGLKAGVVCCALSPAFGPEPVRERLVRSQAAVLVTTTPLLRRTIAPLVGTLPSLRHVLIVDGGAPDLPGLPVTDLDAALLAAPATFTIPSTPPGSAALMQFTSGTTGPPKAAVHAHRAVVALVATGLMALGLREDDVFWCTAEPGWVTATAYGVISPLACGVTSVVDCGEFDAARWYQALEEQRVTVLYTSPTALRMLMRAGDALASQFDLSALRFVASVGEPLSAECVDWGERVLGQPVHDTWWQTETGAIMIGNFARSPVRPGAMGRTFPAIEASTLRLGSDGCALVTCGRVTPAGVGEPGELALRPEWPSMFSAYLHDPAAYAAAFAGGWYLTGDIARRDADGYFWFVGRADDMIKCAGHLVGPFEVERALMAHPAVVEAAAVGAPDAVAGQIVVAFVSLHPTFAPSDALARELKGWARARLGPAVAPRRIVFDQQLPHTTSGKVLRRALREEQGGHDGH